MRRPCSAIVGLFLALVCLLTALCFVLYLWFMINRAKEEIEKESKGK